MVPYSNAAEWCGTTSGCTGGSGTSSFVQNVPAGVTLGACADVTVESSWADQTTSAFCSSTCTRYATSTATIATIAATVTLRFSYSVVTLHPIDCTSYAVQYTENGSTWTTMVGSSVDLTVTNGQVVGLRSAITGVYNCTQNISFSVVNLTDGNATVDALTTLNADIYD